MHLGRKYSFVQFAGWTRREAALLVAWSVAVTLFLQLTGWHFLTIPAPVLAIVGSALAIIIGFKNAQCYARATEALALAGQLVSGSLVLASRLKSLLGRPGALPDGDGLRGFYDRHLAWLTALRFALREPKPWENAAERGNARYLAGHAPPERTTTLAEALAAYLPPADVEQLLQHPGDKPTAILRAQYAAIDRLYRDERISEYGLLMLSAPLEDLVRLQGGLMRIKSYPYARNFYSVAVFLVVLFVVLLPFGVYPYARELGEAAGIGEWTGWLNVPLSAVVGWIFVALEKVGENSSNPFEGGANDVPISAIARRIEIELRAMLGDDPALEPLEPQHDILF